VSWIALVGFFVAIVPLVLTPGASFTLATQRTLNGQRRATLWVVAGTATGTHVHALLAAAGLSALVMRSSEAFVVVKIVGGAYLIGLGLLTIWRTQRHREAPRQVGCRGRGTTPTLRRCWPISSTQRQRRSI
jgi:threonine/homoserine/homoserine lactone efflux protein